MQMTHALKVLKAILATGAASAYLMQAPCTFAAPYTGGGVSIIPNVTQLAQDINTALHGG
jgi:hypothetical protein